MQVIGRLLLSTWLGGLFYSVGIACFCGSFSAGIGFILWSIEEPIPAMPTAAGVLLRLSTLAVFIIHIWMIQIIEPLISIPQEEPFLPLSRWVRNLGIALLYLLPAWLISSIIVLVIWPEDQSSLVPAILVMSVMWGVALLACVWAMSVELSRRDRIITLSFGLGAAVMFSLGCVPLPVGLLCSAMLLLLTAGRYQVYFDNFVETTPIHRLMPQRAPFSVPRTPLSPTERLKLDYRYGLQRGALIIVGYALISAIMIGYGYSLDNWFHIEQNTPLHAASVIGIYLLFTHAPLFIIVPASLPMGMAIGHTTNPRSGASLTANAWHILHLPQTTVRRVLMRHVLMMSGLGVILMTAIHSVLMLTFYNEMLIHYLVFHALIIVGLGVNAVKISTVLTQSENYMFWDRLSLLVLFVAEIKVLVSYFKYEAMYGFSLERAGMYYLFNTGLTIALVLFAWWRVESDARQLDLGVA